MGINETNMETSDLLEEALVVGTGGIMLTRKMNKRKL